jgi:hypothetical protein
MIKRMLFFIALFFLFHLFTWATKPLVTMLIEHDLGASDVSACGVKPHPPVQCLFCESYCMCDDGKNCHWVWLKK